jgi:hypothetical protein
MYGSWLGPNRDSTRPDPGILYAHALVGIAGLFLVPAACLGRGVDVGVEDAFFACERACQYLAVGAMIGPGRLWRVSCRVVRRSGAPCGCVAQAR